MRILHLIDLKFRYFPIVYKHREKFTFFYRKSTPVFAIFLAHDNNPIISLKKSTNPHAHTQIHSNWYKCPNNSKRFTALQM